MGYINVWTRCGISDVVYDFEVYTGKNNKKKDNEIQGTLMVKVVYRITWTRPTNKNNKILFDNFFSSIALLKLLKKERLLSVATLRKDRLKNAGKFLNSQKELKKRNWRSFDYILDYNSGITIMRWFENNSMELISNYVGNSLEEPARRWDRKIQDIFKFRELKWLKYIA